MEQKIGIDIGNVLTQRDTDMRPFGRDYLQVPAYPGAFEAVTELTNWFGKSNIFLVSKCSPRNQALSKDWLIQKGFFTSTGVPTENLFFCEKRIEKRGIADEVGLNYFIDDRWSVLQHMANLPLIERLFLFNPFPDEETRYENEYRGEKIIQIDSWEQILVHIKPEY